MNRTLIVSLLVTVWCAAPAFSQESATIGHQYSALLEQLREPDLAAVKNTNETYRALWLRSFHEPVAVRVFRSGNTYGVVTVQGGRRDSTSLSTEQWNTLHLRDAMKRFWNTVPDDLGGLDGARWILEGRQGGRYHAVDWWSPQGEEGVEGGYRRLFLEILSLGSVCVAPDAVY